MRKEGLDHLQIVSDFDNTISSFKTNEGHKVPSTFGCFEESQGIVRVEMQQKMLAALHKYLPYELDPTLPRELKKVFMNEWNEKVSEIF